MKKPELYTFDNPLWLSDRFVFGKIDGLLCYIKLNYKNKLEEIGVNLPRRVCLTEEIVMKSKLCRPASKLDKSVFNRIGEEYWYHLIKEQYHLLK